MSSEQRPKYQQIAGDLRAAITAGEYRPGDRLPGENDLIARYGVARGTARQALATLATEGTAEARRGAGVFVRDATAPGPYRAEFEYPVGRAAYVTAAPGAPGVTLDADGSVLDLSPDEADALGLALIRAAETARRVTMGGSDT